MVRAGNDPRQMLPVFDLLNRVSQASGGGGSKTVHGSQSPPPFPEKAANGGQPTNPACSSLFGSVADFSARLGDLVKTQWHGSVPCAFPLFTL